MMTAPRSNPAHESVRLAFLTFSLGTQRYALPIEDVVEVAAMVELVQVAGATPELLGLANRHGQVLPVLDLRPIMRQGRSQISASTLFVVAAHGDQYVGLVVDEVQQVVYFNMTQLVHASTREKYIRGIIPYEDQLIQVIALPPLLTLFLPGDLPGTGDFEEPQ